MTSVGSPPASCSLPVSNSLTTEKDLFPTPMDLDHIFESEDSSDETDQQIPNQKSGDENHKGSKGSNIISNGTIAASELSRMYPTPPSLENPVSSPGTVTDIAPETTMTPDSCVKTEVDNSTIINDSSKDWSCVFKPPKLARFVGSTKYAPVELPSAHDTLSNFQIPEYKPSWQYQSHAPSHYLNLPSIENIPSLSKMHVGAIESSPATFPGGSVSRTPMSYEQSPMSNASSSYVNKTLSSIDNQGTNHQLPEVHSVLVNVILGDSSLNIFKDHNFDSCNLCVCNMRVKDDDFNVEDMNRCTCGFSAVMNRMFGHNSGLFYEDEVDITGIKDDRYDQNTHKRLAVIDYQKTGINKDNATNQTALVPEDVPQDILECLLSQFCVPFPSSVAMRMFSKLITNAATSLVDNVVNGISMQDGNEAAYSALEQGRQAAENCSPSKLDDPLMKSSCLHRWPYLQGANRIPLNSQDVLRLLKSLQPLLSDAIQKKRTMRLWEHTYKLSGPLSWKDFHQLAGRGTEENSEPQPIPSFLVGYDKDWLSVSPYALPYWDKLLLEPYGKTRDVAYVVVCPDNEYIFRNVKFFFKELSTVYELCRLGRHSPITKVLRDGILKVGKAASQKYAEESIEGWFNYIGESPVAAKLRLYAKICRYHLGPHLAQQTLDKSLFEACSSKSGHSTPRPSDISQAPATPENQSNSTANSVSGNLSSTQGGSQPATQPQQPQQQQAPMTSGSTTSSSGTSSSGTANTTSSQSANNNSDEANKDGAGGDGNAQREGGLHEQSQESEDSTAECPALVVYMVDPFTYSQEWDHLNRLAMIGLLHCYQELVKTLPEQMQNHVSLQIIPLETVIDQKESGSQYQMLKSLAFSVFTACRWNLMHTVLGRSLTGFGPAAEAELFLKQKEADKAGPLKLYCPPFILAPVKDKQSTLAESCGEKLEKSTIVFCGYCLSEDQRWLLAACTDERGEMKETCIINIEIPNRNRRKKASARKAGLQKLWTFIVGIVSVTTLPCRLVIGRFGRLGHGELKGWAELLGKKNLMKASQQMRDMCTQCSIMSSSETPCILSACLVSMEPQSSFRILVDSIKVEEKMSSNCPLQTPRDASCTHILVFPTSATAQASNHSLHRGEHAMDATYHLGDLGPDALFPHDAIGDAMGDAIGDDMDDLLSIFMNPLPDDKTSAPGSLIHGDEGCQSPSKMGVPSAFQGAGTTTNDLQEEGGTLLQQPLAMGYYVSTASTGPLPKWFWSSCPEAENVCPNILKAALHTHSSSKQDDPLPLQSTHSRNIHPLDSNLTCDVLRFVLENYNALSWLTMDPVKNDRRSCLPVHFVMLMQMYHAINAYV